RGSSHGTAYSVELARGADRLARAFGLLLAALSLVLAWRLQAWMPWWAVAIPALAVIALQPRRRAGTRQSGVVAGLALMALVAVTIHQADGRPEAHAGAFVVLALLLCYRDWLPVAVAAAALAVHHAACYWLQARGLPVQAFAADVGAGSLALQGGYLLVAAVFACIV